MQKALREERAALECSLQASDLHRKALAVQIEALKAEQTAREALFEERLRVSGMASQDGESLITEKSTNVEEARSRSLEAARGVEAADSLVTMAVEQQLIATQRTTLAETQLASIRIGLEG